MKAETRHWLGIVTGFISAMIGFFLLEPIKFRYILGVFLTSAGILFIGLCAYHLGLAKKVDRLRNSKKRSKGK